MGSLHPSKVTVPSSFPCSSLAPLLRLQWERCLESRQLADLNQHQYLPMYTEAVDIAWHHCGQCTLQQVAKTLNPGSYCLLIIVN